jgi:Na+/H+ antiporter NhaD/arsenite permease-like protein
MLIRTSTSSNPVPQSARRRFWRQSIVLACGAVALIVSATVFALWLLGSALELQSIWRRDGANIAAIIIFTATYAVIAIGRLPGSHMDRAGAALLGASLMLATGLLSLDDAYRAIDVDAIALLLGMMIVVANIRISGFFRLVSNWIVTRAGHPLVLLAAVILISGFFSAFLVNDAVCLALTPLVLDFVTRLRRNPVPYLLALAMASNIGSTATITGNPQNIMIGSFSQIPYAAFSAALWPIATVGLLLTLLLIALSFPREFWTRERPHAQPVASRVHPALLIKSVGITVVMVIACFAGQPPAKAALISGALLLLTRRVKSEKVYRRIDWTLLLMFMGLFIVVAGFEKAALTPEAVQAVGSLHLDRLPALSLVTAALSNLVSNVPAVLVLKPFVTNLPEPQRAWLAVAMSSTLAGNLSIVGSVANLIVVQVARTHGIKLGFWEHAKVGAPLSLITIVFGVVWLQFSL